jgi:hypothetical protein
LSKSKPKKLKGSFVKTYWLYEASYKKYPEMWFENEKIGIRVAQVLGTILVLMSWKLNYFPLPPLWLSIIVSIIYLMVVILDNYTTILVSNLHPAAQERGLYYAFDERNPFLPSIPTTRDLVFGFRAHLADMIMLTFSFVIPALGIALTLSRVFTCMNNYLGYKRFKLAIELFDKKIRSVDYKP